MNLSIKHKKPIGNGIITCFNDKQASDRRKKGAEAAVERKHNQENVRKLHQTREAD